MHYRHLSGPQKLSRETQAIGSVLPGLVVNLELKSRKLNPDKMPPEPEPFLSVYGGMICSKRNILVISGPSKSGKSAVGSAIIGGAMTSDRNAHTLGLTVAPNTSGKGIIYVDTEQSWFNFNRNGRNAVRRALLRDFPSYYHAYWLKGLVPKQKLQHTWEACRMHAEDHGGLHALFVDGIGDYVMSVNNEEVCGFVVDEFSRMSEEFDCPVITVLHKNPGSDKQRGWLGTILQMKAEAIISVDFNKKTATSTISYDFLRNAGFVPEIKFRWDDQARYHRFESYDERTKALADQFTSGDSGVLARIFTYCDQDEMPIESFKPFYEAATGRADGFQSFYDRCFEKGFISVNGSKIQLISI